jgi:hypothetical protein
LDGPKRQSFFSENMSCGTDFAKNLQLQAMEMDADYFGASNSLHLAMHSHDVDRRRARTDLESPRGGPLFNPDRPLSFFDWSFALSSYFWLFGIGDEIKKPEEGDHPPDSLRHYLSSTFAGRTHHAELSRYLTGDIDDVIELVFKHATLDFAHINNCVMPFEALHMIPENRARLEEHRDKIFAKWTEIRPAILAFSYVDDLAIYPF